MRPIKFRVWHSFTSQQRMYPALSVDFVNRRTEVEPNHYLGFRAGPLMQFTGLHDKNGTEIYELDLLKFHDPTFDSSIYRVTWSKERGRWERDRSTNSNPNHYWSLADSLPEHAWEVVGNVYENPDLLEKEAA